MSRNRYLDFRFIKKRARELRSNLTTPEKILWEVLRNRRFNGLKFLRQHPVVYKADFKGLNYFIADFYCNEKKVIIELDGNIHDSKQDYDRYRDNELIALGIRVLRIKNSELQDLPSVLQKIKTFLYEFQ
ncbi:MAG TPA: endonuclease domain-containing protein [Bacteroidales bacterium]|nr:endonuclease domain-containing protein [Bacteroidales bacterium]